ncbi:response regulator transcription factor [Labrys monachus]|uniref:Two-component system torCAD operon response regulator TorR n=1 Tax=Labrys monachus TaxID=217067 RepID=A0ABU0F6Z3_9HYPH|nr:response regulator transcription factor [Labrys monachus]MDQ0390335.1 two-component system torCAD operon response regulator TorR [Labrys monachus]
MPPKSDPPQPPPRSGQPTRVVLVEDDHDLRQGLAEYLRLSGIMVVDVASAAALYKALRREDFDIVILDVNLPDISGFELARDLSAERRTGVIILTARTSREDRIQGYAEGADLYLTKPVDGEELVLAVRNLARRVHQADPASEERPAVETARTPPDKPWRLELRHYRLISPEGHAIPLSGREVMLMEHLAHAQGATVARSTLATLLGYDIRSPESRGLDAVLRRLRHKALENGSELPLHAIHSVGIRFSGPLSIV